MLIKPRCLFGDLAECAGGSPITVPFLRNARLPTVNTVAIAATLGTPIALFGAVGYAVTGWNNPGLPAWTTGYV